MLSSVPGDKYPEVHIRQADKIVHFLIYVPLGMFFCRSALWLSAADKWGFRGIIGTLAAGFAYGASDEFHQLWVRNRTCSLYDWLVDCAAVATGLILFSCLRSRYRK